jgi:signal peptidase II
MPWTQSGMQTNNRRTRNSIIFFASAGVWLVIDQLTKALADTAGPGTLLWPGIRGVFDFYLVHNIGGAWGIFSGNTFALGLFALIVCAAVLVIAHMRRSKAGSLEMFSLALIFAGGAGNAIDRFIRGYVVDFFDFRLIHYPVFNVADIGVVVGFTLLLLVLIRECREADDAEGDSRSH